MKILIIKPILPYPPTQGTRRVTLNLLNALQGPHEVTVLCKTLTDDEDKLVGDLSAHCSKVVAIRAPNTRSFLHKVFFKFYYCLRTLLTLVSLRAQYDCPGEIVKAAEAITGAEDYDLVLVEYWSMAAAGARAKGRVKVLFEHDVDCLRNRERYSTAGDLLTKLSRYAAWKLEERGQLRSYPLFDAILTLTGFDRKIIQELANRDRGGRGDHEAPQPVHVLPTGVDGSFFEGKNVEEEPNSILFVGSFAADFNVDSVRYLVEDVLPHVRDELPQARLYIAGGNAPPEVEALGRAEGVTFLGLQKDLTGPLASKSVFVVPLRFAGGIRIRTLEAMAMGKAIVTTSVGIRGIEAKNGRDLLIADGEGDFAAAIADLLKDPERRRRLGAAAQAFAKKNYGMEVARSGTVELFDSLLREGGRH